MKTKKFDCVLMKRKAAEKIYVVIKNFSIEEELRFWNNSKPLKTFRISKKYL